MSRFFKTKWHDIIKYYIVFHRSNILYALQIQDVAGRKLLIELIMLISWLLCLFKSTLLISN